MAQRQRVRLQIERLSVQIVCDHVVDEVPELSLTNI